MNFDKKELKALTFFSLLSLFPSILLCPPPRSSTLSLSTGLIFAESNVQWSDVAQKSLKHERLQRKIYGKEVEFIGCLKLIDFVCVCVYLFLINHN